MRAILRGLVVLAMTTAFLTGCTTPTGGTVFEVGDCLKTKVDANGHAVKAQCTDPESMKVADLAKNGQRPHCEGGSAVTSFVEDTATRVTYCGPYNR